MKPLSGAQTPRSELLRAWRAWDEHPGNREAVVAFEAAARVCAARLNVEPGTFRDLLAVFRRAGVGREDALDCSIPAGQALAARMPNLPLSSIGSRAPRVGPVV